MFSAKNIKKWLLAVFAIETICATYCLKIPGYHPLFSIIYFLAGITITILITVCPQIKINKATAFQPNNFASYIKPGIWITMLILAYFMSRYWFDMIDIDADYADMLPVIKVMNERFLSGQWKHIYDPIKEIWGGTNPIYLPAMWLPFTPATIFNFDMRWVTVACLLFSFSAFLFMMDFKKNAGVSIAATVIAFILFCWLFAQDDAHGVISMSEEGVVIFYYVLLVLAIASGNIFFIGIAVSLCMLSRYALIGWLIAFLLYLLLNKNKRQLLIFISTGMAAFLILFVLPFGWHAFTQLLKLPGSYIEFSKTVWRDSPEVFWLSLGFAKFFGPARSGLLHATLITMTFLVPVLFVLLCFYYGKKRKIANVPLATLKISIVIFYSFIDVPYLYLFYTSSFISLIAVALLIRVDMAKNI